MTATPERCPRCDQPKGDQDRADSLPVVRQWLDEHQPGRGRVTLRWRDVVEAQVADQPGLCLDAACKPVDWRQRALDAEARADAAEAREAGLRETIARLGEPILGFTGPLDGPEVSEDYRIWLAAVDAYNRTPSRDAALSARTAMATIRAALKEST